MNDEFELLKLKATPIFNTYKWILKCHENFYFEIFPMSAIVHAENSDPFLRKKNLLRLFQLLMDTKTSL